MLLNLEFEILILLIPALILSLCVHEYSHGITAYYYGDDTAYQKGRLTLNPMMHLDPVGTMMPSPGLISEELPASSIISIWPEITYMNSS